jgi:WD40 repeat protein
MSAKCGFHRWLNVDITGDGKYLLINTVREELQLWEIASATCLHVFKLESAFFRWAYFDSSDSCIIAPLRKKLYIWRLDDYVNEKIIDVCDSGVRPIIDIQDKKIYCNTSDSTTNENLLKTWIPEIQAFRTRFNYPLDKKLGAVTMYSIFGPYLALTAADESQCEIWDMDRQIRLHILSGHTEKILSAVFSPDGLHLLTGAADSTMRLWDVEAGNCLKIL